MSDDYDVKEMIEAIRQRHGNMLQAIYIPWTNQNGNEVVARVNPDTEPLIIAYINPAMGSMAKDIALFYATAQIDMAILLGIIDSKS